MTPHIWPYKAKNCEIHDPKSLYNQFDGSWVAFFGKKRREVATVVCVCDMDIEASSLPLIAIHTKLWQLLSCSATYP